MIFKLFMIVSLNATHHHVDIVDYNLTREDCIEALIDANYNNHNQYVSFECLGEE